MTYGRLGRFFHETLWTTDTEELPLHKRIGITAARIVYILFKGFSDENLNQQAAALTFVSFLSLVPLLAVLFSLAKGFGFQEQVEPWVEETLGRFMTPDILQRIMDYINRTPVGALGAVGFLVLLWTVLKTLFHLERSLNRIWSVPRARPLYRALAYYLSVVLIVPLLVGASTTLTAALKTAGGEGGAFAWFQRLPGASGLAALAGNLLPYAITVAAFTLVYAFMVNSHVRLHAAFAGALVGGFLWNVLKGLYIESQILLSVNPLYGTFAFLPVFLAFMYLSWLVLLFGGRIAFAVQNLRAFRRERLARAAGHRFLVAAGLAVLHAVTKGFQDGAPPPDESILARELDLSLPLVQGILDRLEAAGLVYRVSEARERGSGTGVVPSRGPGKIPLASVVAALENGDDRTSLPAAARTGKVPEIVDALERARDEALRDLTLADLLAGAGTRGEGEVTSS